MHINDRRQTREFLQVQQLERRDCPATVSVSGGREITEGEGSVALQFTLSEPLAVRASVTYSTAGSTARYRSDYTLSPLYNQNRITFLPGETSKTLVVAILNDTLREPTERISFSLGNPVNCSLGTARTTVSIRDDDSYSVAMIGPTGRVNEGSQAAFMIQLSSPATKVESFRISAISESARAGQDFTPFINRLVTIPKGARSAAFAIPVMRDSTPESDETFLVRTVAALPGTPLPPPLRVTISETVTPPPPPPVLAISNATVTEGNNGTTIAAFTLALSAATTQTVTVTYATVDGSATAGDLDYTPLFGTVSFLPGETSKSIAVSVRGDTKPEPSESFFLSLTAPVNCTLASTTAAGTIINDDADQPGFQITVNYIGDIPDLLRQIVDSVARGWEQVITGDLPSVVHPVTGKLIDDFVLDVQIGLTGPKYPTGSDPTATILANAGPFLGAQPGITGVKALRPSGLPYNGSIGFNPAYLFSNAFSQQETFFTAAHEIAHALGFGVLWSFDPADGIPYPQNSLVQDPLSDAPRYVGANAVREFNNVYGSTLTWMPIQNEGQGKGSHWNESLMRAELMTPIIDYGVKCPLSRITIGAMQDLGYTVNYDAADAYASFNFLEWPESAGGNGHAYALFNDSVSWPEARRIAESLIPPTGFRRGTLVSINSAAENQFLASWVPSTSWMGFTDELVDGEWRWIDGSPGVWQDPANFRAPVQTIYVNWAPGEPSRFFMNYPENYGLFRWGSDTWNDGVGPVGGSTFPFVVEFVRL